MQEKLPLQAAGAADLKEPLTLTSENGILDVLMVAKAGLIATLAPFTPAGWVYEICKRPADNSINCPASPSGPNYYGGTLLRLFPGDTLKVHLVNRLPLALDSKHALEPGRAYLKLNPTNIHTHGMLVAPSVPTARNPAYGDYVFVLTFNSANGTAEPSPHMHATPRGDFTDYAIKIPASHPSGLFWFHPHAHGLALNQVSAGLSGIITVGNPADYVCKGASCAGFFGKSSVRHVILKDAQIRPDGTLQDQEDPFFCSPSPASGEGPRLGSCAGQDNSSSGGTNYTGGKWFFTLNGRQNATVPIASGGGEIWRMANLSGSVTYDLNLWNPAGQRNMLMQVLSVDGVSVSPTPGISQAQLTQTTGGKFDPEPCPGAPSSANSPEPLCTRRLHMMPSSRIEVWVAYRDANDNLASPPNGAKALLRTAGYQTGPAGDSWPSITLGTVQFQQPLDPNAPAALTVNGEANALLAPLALSANLLAANREVASDPSCKPLAPGHMRRPPM